MSFSHEIDGAIEDIVNDAVIHEEGVPSVALDLESLDYTDSIKDKIHSEFSTLLDLFRF
jgi:Bacteriophage T4-like capsid assembly protein (Gp20).